MEDLREKANNYAEENVINVLKEAFAKVYADGFREGYQARDEEIPVDLRDNKTEYVDLGLPSGTLWAADYEKEEGNRMYIPYGRASLLNIPTKDQWKELYDTCKWEFDIDRSYDLCEARCVGPNGNILRFERTGKKNVSTQSDIWEVFFWVGDETEGNDKEAVHIYNYDKKNSRKNGYATIDEFFSGYKLPVRLVRTK